MESRGGEGGEGGTLLLDLVLTWRSSCGRGSRGGVLSGRVLGAEWVHTVLPLQVQLPRRLLVRSCKYLYLMRNFTGHTNQFNRFNTLVNRLDRKWAFIFVFCWLNFGCK